MQELPSRKNTIFPWPTPIWRTLEIATETPDKGVSGFLWYNTGNEVVSVDPTRFRNMDSGFPMDFGVLEGFSGVMERGRLRRVSGSGRYLANSRDRR